MSNEGQENLLFLVGDSHTMKISHRFQQLYKESLLKFVPFPTIVSLVKWGLLDLNSDDEYVRRKIIGWVEKHRPRGFC